MKLVFFGTAEFAVPILESIVSQTDCEISLVVSELAKPAGRGLAMFDSPVAAVAKKL